jgi:predicted DNA-binding transcriptional regulator AlpA
MASGEKNEPKNSMTEREAAAYLGVSPTTLNNWRARRQPPVWVKLGKAVRYLKSDLDAFLLESRIDPTVDHALSDAARVTREALEAQRGGAL